MEGLVFIKEEPEYSDYYESGSIHYDMPDSCPTIKSENQSDDEVEAREEFVDTEENNNQNVSTPASSYPKLSIPLVRLEYSQNHDIIKYLKPLLPAIKASTKLQSNEQTTEPNLNLKMESVELETLTEGTLVQSPRNYYYASPWNFVSVQTTYSRNNSLDNKIKTEVEDDYGIENKSESSSPQHMSNLQNTSILKKKFLQSNLNFEVIPMWHMRDGKTIAKTPVQISNCDLEKSMLRRSDLPGRSNQDILCNSCNQGFTSRLNFIRHTCTGHKRGINKTDKYIVCEICQKPFREMWRLRQHRSTHDITKWYECDVCKKKFKMKSYLRQHIKSHDLKYYSCRYCERHYTYKSTLKRHMTMRNGNCRKIKKRVSQNPILEIGIENNTNNEKAAHEERPLKLYECDICSERFKDKSSMQVHIEFLHIEIFGHSANKPLPQLAKPSLRKPFQCPTCKKSYTQLPHLYRHQKSHLPRKPYVCELCDERFTSTSSVSRHLLRKHNTVYSTRKAVSKKTSKNFVCKICDKVFRNAGDLRRHCAIHDKRRPYECDICKKQFAVKGYLYAHILTHNNWKPYPCQSCSKIYRRKSSLQRHINISHSDRKRFECDICQKSWKYKLPYDRHMESSHPNSTSNESS